MAPVLQTGKTLVQIQEWRYPKRLLYYGELYPKDKEYRILYEADLSPVFTYVKTKYGENFIDLYEH